MTNETNDLKAGTNAPIHVLIRPFQEFAVREASEGILLLLCTVAALLWITSPLAARYEALWKAKLTLRVAEFVLDHDLRFWVNDGLMAIFLLCCRSRDQARTTGGGTGIGATGRATHLGGAGWPIPSTRI